MFPLGIEADVGVPEFMINIYEYIAWDRRPTTRDLKDALLSDNEEVQ
jgi:hypothetical protein